LRGADDSAPQNQNVGPTRDGTVIAAALKSWPFDRIELFWTSDGAPIPLDALDPELRPLDIVLSSSAPASPAWPAHDKVIAFDALAERSCARMGLEAERPARRSRSRGIGKPRRSFDLAFVYPYETPESLRFLLALAPALRARGGAALVLGATSGDERLSSDRVFATGPVEREEVSRLLDVYRAPRFASPYRGEGFWALESVRVASPAPIAYFDWTRSEFRLRLGDLALDPDLADSVAAELLLDWAFAPVTTPVASRKRAHA
jgi:hypothetical protein